MIYKDCGETGKKVSAVGFGGMRFETPENIEKNAALVKMAYDAGINYFDSAPFYCNDKSEDIFGEAIKQIQKTADRNSFYIATKTSQDNPAAVRKELERSLKRLNVEYIDFYYFWCIINYDQYENRKANGVLAEFEKLKEEGLIKHVCVSTHMTGDNIAKMLDDYPFEAVLLGYNVTNFAYRQKALDYAAKLHKPVVVMNPLAGGLIPENPKMFDFIKTAANQTVTQAAIGFLINDPTIMTALIGFSNQKQIEEAIAAVDNFEPISQKKINDIKKHLNKCFDKICTGCRYCDKCPQGVEVPKLMDAYNHLMLSGTKSMIERLYWHWSIDPKTKPWDKCVNCRLCEKLCTQKLPITERLQQMQTAYDESLKQKL